MSVATTDDVEVMMVETTVEKRDLSDATMAAVRAVLMVAMMDLLDVKRAAMKAVLMAAMTVAWSVETKAEKKAALKVAS